MAAFLIQNYLTDYLDEAISLAAPKIKIQLIHRLK